MQFQIGFIVVTFTLLTSFFNWQIPSPEQREEVFGRENVSKLPTSFNVLVWNIYKGRKKERFLKEFSLHSEKKDLILLQEAIRGDIIVENAFTNKKNYEFFMVTSFYRKENGTTIKTGVATGSIISAVARKSEKSPHDEAGVTIPKVSAYTYYPLGESGETLLVINIHALNFVFFKAFQDHILQSNSYIKEHKGPVIFAGDFNTNFPQGTRKKKFLLNYTKELGLTKIYFDNDARKKNGYSCKIKNEIDYIFIRGLIASNSQVPDSSGSDHCPLIATLTLDE